MATRYFRWAVMLCNFSDQPTEPNTPQYFGQLIGGLGLGSLHDYWSRMSYGALDMTMSVVYGWVTLPSTQSGLSNITGPGSRDTKIQMCKFVTAPRADFGSVHSEERRSLFYMYDGYIAIVAGNAGDRGAAGNGILADAGYWDPTWLAHEMGHVVLGLNESFDTSPTTWSPVANDNPGAYGDGRDIMSARTFANQPTTFPSRFGTGGPGLNAITREKVGWLAADRIYTITQNWGEEFGVQVPIGPLDSAESPFNLMVKVKANGVRPGPAAVTYTIEYRPRAGWDSGLPADEVVIHIIRDGDVPRIIWATRDTQGWVPGQTFVDEARGILISVVQATPTMASVMVSSTLRRAWRQISVRATFAHKVDITDGLRPIAPMPGLPSDSLRARLLNHPPQLPS